MRIPLVLTACSLLCLAFVSGAHADETGATAPPSWSMESFAPGADALPEGYEMPEGWTLETGEAGALSKDALTAIAEGVGLTDMDFYAELRAVAAPGGSPVGVAWVDIDASDPKPVRAALDAAATEKGWRVRDIGTPYRLLIVGAGADQAKVAKQQLEHAIARFSEMALNRIRAQSRREDVREAARSAARGFEKMGRSLKIDAGSLDTISAAVLWSERSEKQAAVRKAEALIKRKERAGDDEAKAKAEADLKVAKAAAQKYLDAFLEKAEAAFKAGRPNQAKGSLAVFVAGNAGGELLERKKSDLNARAAHLLEVAVANEGESKSTTLSFGNRYNLSCAYARLGDKDKAFLYLEKTLDLGKSMPVGQYGPRFLHLRDKDEDMSTLRSDPRWDKLLERYADERLDKWEVAHKKRQAEAEKKKREREEGAKEKDDGDTEGEGDADDDADADEDTASDE